MNMRNTIIALVIMAGWSVTARPAGTPTKENTTSGYSAATSEDPDVTEAKARIYEFYERYIATFIDSDEKPEDIRKEFMTRKCIKQTAKATRLSMTDEIIRAQDSGEDALKSLEVKHVGGNRYIVYYTFNPGLEYESSTSIPLETTTVDGTTYISYIKPSWDHSIKEKDVLMNADVLPEYPGGFDALNEFITQNLRYPLYALRHNIEGRVIVSFVVKSDGSVCNPLVVEPAHECLNSEAERIIDILPDFTPATNKGKPVNIKLSIPINFRMSPQNQ